METISAKLPATKVAHLLIEVGIPPHRVGYLQLCVALPLFKKNKQQSMASDLYPAVAETLGYPDWRAVEHSMRDAILAAWEHRDPEIWKTYFPGCTEAPSNKRFIATLVEFI